MLDSYDEIKLKIQKAKTDFNYDFTDDVNR